MIYLDLQHRYCTDVSAKIHTSIVADHIPLSIPAARGRKRKAMTSARPVLGFQELLEMDIREDARNTEVSLGTYIHRSVNPISSVPN